MRPPSGGDDWPEVGFKLYSTEMVAVEPKSHKEIAGRIIESYEISPSCSVFSTNLAENAFELVTKNKVLHVAALTQLHMEDWIFTIRR